MIKKLSYLLCLLTLTFASAQTFAVNGINYNVTNTTAPLTVEVGSNYSISGNVNLPKSVKNPASGGLTYTLTSIGSQAFNSSTMITCIIPSSVISIGDNAFNFCAGLTSLNVPNSVISIGAGCFSYCTNLNSVIIPNSVTSIGDYAFNNCTSLTSIVIPNSMTAIPPACFQNCSALTTVTIPNTVNTIEASAFAYCTSLTSIFCNVANPLPIVSNVFYNVNQATCKLTVPASAVNAYQAAIVWKNFNPIVGDATLSTSELNSKNDVVLYPNPVHDEAILEVKNFEHSKLEVYDMNGKMVLRKSLNNNSKNIINTSNLPAGIYLFKVGKSVTKVIKN